MKFRFIFIILFFCFQATAQSLKEYVDSAEKYSNVEELSRAVHDKVSVTFVSFISHTWHDIPWQHSLLIFEPEGELESAPNLLIIGGGNNESLQAQELFEKKMKTGEAKLAYEAARYRKIKSAVLFNVPNQPLFENKKEDDLLAMSLDRYSKTGDATWPLLFPMVAAATRGLDLLSERWNSKNFVVTGASKRGWTTYLLGALDSRVIGIAPAVYEMLDIPEQIQLIRLRYGKDSAQLKAYSQLQLTDRLDEPRIKILRSWIDPVFYPRAMSLPKFLLLGANDPYWVVDSVSRYWTEFSGSKLIRTLPNVGHGVFDSESGRRSVIEFVHGLSEGSLPELTWKIDRTKTTARIEITSSRVITGAKLWVADSETPDFRKSFFHDTGFRSVQEKSFLTRLSLGQAPWRTVLVEVWFSGMPGQSYTLEPVVLSSDSAKLSIPDALVQ